MRQQAALIDIAHWEPDPRFAVFPQGARAKEAVISPEHPPDPCLTPARRYLFKRSKKSYPDQFWGEVVAYRLGCAMGVEVPPAFAAWNSDNSVCGALIEWFYVDAEELSLLAGDLLTLFQSDFDRDRGLAHNLRDTTKLMRMLLGSRGRDRQGTHWRQWWAKTLFFDTLIGNTDRHQDNWVVLLNRQPHSDEAKRFRLGPCFDNGTSLGHERFTDRVADWTEADIERYVNKGKHHIKWSLDEPVQGHFDLLQRAWNEWPETRAPCRDMAAALSAERLHDVLCDLPRLSCPVALSAPRYAFMLRLLLHRMARLKALLHTP